ncbi:acetyltransferase, N-acetylglutamate synthase [Acidovorax sp. CF316]|uniref:GNAT family N-acetyltransferase n=1 Tax=Acidovorax sp. CF316 TaxID=1144317 RepID=UPI00026BCFA2|nr:GNAT family N-acetyltransferase [Acidovorax sp. CF316]EJE52192.1 acetyltransferase, N-acetylglutamate synthase [Acidovorax sp. CF316]
MGYEASEALVVRKLAILAAQAGDNVLLAEVDGRVASVISLHVLELFRAEGRIGRITSLVVDAGQRGRGVGEALVAAADRFFTGQGCVRAEVTSGDHRPAAHAFYAAQGYAPDERRFLKRYVGLNVQQSG